MLVTAPSTPPLCAAGARVVRPRRGTWAPTAAPGAARQRASLVLDGALLRSLRLRSPPNSAADSAGGTGLDLLNVVDEPPDKLLGEVVHCLLSARASSVPAAVVLPKFHDSLSPRAYMSVIVALSRKEAWETAAEVAFWVRKQGTELPTLAYVCIAQRRLQEGHWDRALEVYSWMKDLGCTPSGESVELLAILAAREGLSASQSARVRDVVSWVRVSEAGQALWDIFVGLTTRAQGTYDPMKPAWSSKGLALEDADELLHGPLEDLREALRDIMEPIKQPAPPVERPDVVLARDDDEQPLGNAALPDIDALLRSKRRT